MTQATNVKSDAAPSGASVGARFDVPMVTAWCATVMSYAGIPELDARRAAGLLVRSEVRGYASHGLMRLPTYVERLRCGDFNPRPAMNHCSVPGGIVLDADGALGHVAAARALELGLRALEGSATVLVVMRSVAHMGALGVFVLEAAEAGALCMIGQTGPAVMALEGFSAAAMGNNPIAFGCPIPGQTPLVFDMASSTAARGKIQNAAREGHDIPPGWALDRTGRPTTHARTALEGWMLPAAGPKGMGIAMMVQCLAAGLAANADALAALHIPVPIGGSLGRQSAFMWLIKPTAFAPPGAFAEQMQSWTGHYLRSGAGVARLPGDAGARREVECLRAGVPLEGELLAALRRLGDTSEAPFPPALEPERT
jgi:LDH2 family malate/lactate/ureidoglycolate dehydrogenase